jgi:hypothetical protein
LHGAPVVADPAIHRGAPDQILGAIDTTPLTIGIVRATAGIAPLAADPALNPGTALKAPVATVAAAMIVAPVTVFPAVFPGIDTCTVVAGHRTAPRAGWRTAKIRIMNTSRPTNIAHPTLP